MMLNKDITFIYSDSAEKAIYMPIMQEAQKRGYKTNLTMDKFAKCEIGFYCQHLNFPQYSRFSIIMLHDIIQQYSNWPNLWYREPWNKYDIGILPSSQWEANWNQCSRWFYSNPRVGMYKIGWPKADIINEIQKKSSKGQFYKKYGLNLQKRTILYAPAWENDRKQDDFVKSMLKLDVNIIIKQWDADPIKFPGHVKNVREMESLHRNNKRIVILPPSTNIFEAIAVSDILVSEESSTMCEAAMMGIPAVSVSDWLIPDVTPSRYPKCDYDFVVKTTKEQLSTCISNMIQDYDAYKRNIEKFRDQKFSNIGSSSSMIMDIIDDIADGHNIRYKALIPSVLERPSIKSELKRKLLQIKLEIAYNYCVRYKLLSYLWKFYIKIKNIL